MYRIVFISLLGLFLLLTIARCSRSGEESSPESTTQEAAAAEEAVIASGRFIDKGGQTTSGSFSLERSDGDLRLVLDEEFQTDEGPDLHVVLTPTRVAEASNENVMVDGAEVVDTLARQAGQQVYDLRDDLSLDPYHSVVIHCIQFSHLYGAAPLR